MSKKSKPNLRKKKPIEKLSEKLKEQIKTNPKSFKKSDLTGEALTYRNRVIGIAKARKVKQAKYIYIDGKRISKDSESYRLVMDLAENEGLTLKEFLKKGVGVNDFLSTHIRYNEHYLVKVEQMIDSLTKKQKIFNQGSEVTIPEIKLDIDELIQTAVSFEYYPDISIEVGQDLYDNMYLNIPTINETTSLQSEDDFLFMLDSRYPEIIVHKDTRKAKKAAKEAERKRNKNK